MKIIWDYMIKYKKYVFINAVSVIGFVLIEIGIPTLLANGINVGFNGGDTNYIVGLALKMILFAIIGLVSLIIMAHSTSRLVNGVVRDMRNDIFEKVQTFSHEEYEKFGVSRLITNTGNDCFQIMQFLGQALRIGLMAPIMFIASFLMIFVKSPSLSMALLVSVPLMLVAVYFINQVSKPLSIEQQKGLDGINLNMREGLSGLRVIRAFNTQDFQEDRFDEINSRYAGYSKKMFQVVAIGMPLFTVLFTIVIAAVIWFGSGQVNQDVLEYGSLVAFIEYVFHALFSFMMLANVFTMYPRTAVSAGRIKEVLDTEPVVNANEDGVKETETEGVLEFKNVSFAYSDHSEEPVIRDISFTANPGETVSFIGSTGSGKSTLIQLIPRFFDVTKGSIEVDGVDIREYDIDVLRQKIGYVPQKALLFSGTIEENLRFGNPDATMEDIEKAAEIAQAKDFVESKDDRYQEILSEGGTNLSGGQKQRLCIARAIVREPSIYVFDDSFSALDYKTDALLRERLSQETKNSTVLIVAQRVNTIMDSDKIIVLDQGRVVGMGTHEELLKENEIYYEIASSQLSKEELSR